MTRIGIGAAWHRVIGRLAQERALVFLLFFLEVCARAARTILRAIARVSWRATRRDDGGVTVRRGAVAV